MRNHEPVVLGIWDGHDASVAIVAGGSLVFALSEERPRRRKRYSGFPSLALARALEWAENEDLTITDIALAGRLGRAPLRLFEPLYARSDPSRDELSLASATVRHWENLVPRLPGLRRLEHRAGLVPLRLRLRSLLADGVRMHTVAHHDAHAWSALFGADGEPSVVVTWDAYGEGIAATARTGEQPEVLLDALGVDVGLARLYGAVTQGLGFAEGDEGKVMGRAARGETQVALGRFRQLFDQRVERPRLLRPLSRRRVAALLDGLRVEDAAAGLQALTEELVTGWVQGLLRGVRTPRRLLLAGGLFANIRVNEELAGLSGVSGLFVFPNMVDGGLSAGAAARVWAMRTGGRLSTLTSAALGPPPGPHEMRAAVEASGLPWRRVEQPAACAAEHLAAGRVLCRYEGRDEFGPRALGQRSILFSAIEPRLGDRVNEALGRDPYMPFGPVLCAEDVPAALATQRSARELAWMTVSVDATPALSRACPVAVHVDGSTRPQVATANDGSGLHGILRRYREAGGPPAVINTSFNRHGEPIVHSPRDAVRTFRASGLDVLLMGNWEVCPEGEST